MLVNCSRVFGCESHANKILGKKWFHISQIFAPLYVRRDQVRHRSIFQHSGSFSARKRGWRRNPHWFAGHSTQYKWDHNFFRVYQMNESDLPAGHFHHLGRNVSLLVSLPVLPHFPCHPPPAVFTLLCPDHLSPWQCPIRVLRLQNFYSPFFISPSPHPQRSTLSVRSFRRDESVLTPTTNGSQRCAPTLIDTGDSPHTLPPPSPSQNITRGVTPPPTIVQVRHTLAFWKHIYCFREKMHTYHWDPRASTSFHAAWWGGPGHHWSRVWDSRILVPPSDRERRGHLTFDIR